MTRGNRTLSFRSSEMGEWFDSTGVAEELEAVNMTLDNPAAKIMYSREFELGKFYCAQFALDDSESEGNSESYSLRFTLNKAFPEEIPKGIAGKKEQRNNWQEEKSYPVVEYKLEAVKILFERLTSYSVEKLLNQKADMKHLNRFLALTNGHCLLKHQLGNQIERRITFDDHESLIEYLKLDLDWDTTIDLCLHEIPVNNVEDYLNLPQEWARKLVS